MEQESTAQQAQQTTQQAQPTTQHPQQATGQAQQTRLDVLTQQYEILLQSSGYLELVVIAALMSYYALELQREHFEKIFAGQLDPSTPPLDTFPIDFAASGLIMGSLTYFYDLSLKGLETPTTDPQVRQEAEINMLASSLVLLAGVLRLYNLVYQEMHIKQAQQPAVEEELEEAEPF